MNEALTEKPKKIRTPKAPPPPRKPLKPISFDLSQRMEETIYDLVLKIKLGKKHRKESAAFLRYALFHWRFHRQLSMEMTANLLIDAANKSMASEELVQ